MVSTKIALICYRYNMLCNVYILVYVSYIVCCKIFYLIKIFPPFSFSTAIRQGNLSLPLNRELVEKGQSQMIIITDIFS